MRDVGSSRKRSVVALAASLLGCGEIAGLDDYTVSDHGTYLAGEACNACLAKNCADELSTCNKDEWCRTTLAKRRRCSDPECHFGKYFRSYGESLWDSDPLADPYPADHELDKCATVSCGDDCAIGRSWACVGQYSWHTPAPGVFKIHHRIENRLGSKAIEGALVAACDPLDVTCSTPLAGPVPTDAEGRVELVEPRAETFEPYLRVDHDKFPPYSIFGKQKPRFSGEYTAYGMIPWPAVEMLAVMYKQLPYDASYAYVWTQFSDCDGFPADNVRIEVTVVDGDHVGECADCSILYTQGDPTTLTEALETGEDSMVLINHLDPLSVVVTARDLTSGKVVARTELGLAAGRVHGMTLMPLTRELAREK